MELISLLGVFCICFVAVPAAAGTSSGDGPWIYRAAAGFVLMSLFFRVALMFTGLLQANFPGIVAALWVLWSMALLTWSGGRHTWEIKPRIQTGFLRVLQALEDRPFDLSRLQPGRVSRTCALFCAVVTAAFIQRAWYPLHNLRFSRIETYTRTLDLERFLHRDAPFADGAAYVLEPLGVFSGLYADSVIRLSGPLFSTLLVLAVALCAYRFLRSADAALVAAALMSAWPAVVGNKLAGETSSAEMAAVYWVLGAVFLGRNWYLALYSVCTALLVSWKVSPAVLVAAVCIALSYVFVRLVRLAPAHYRSIPAGAVAGLTVLLLLADCDSPAAEGPFEYEAAARACRSIAAQFPRNEWLIISPVHELAFTYGRGWHFELLDFVSTHTIGEITPREFSFPYDVRDIFVFVEKQPLEHPSSDELGSLDLTQTMDRAVLAYHTGLGRTSVEFQAGALLAAYGINHQNASIFQQDERFVVFRIHKERDTQPPARAG